MKMLLKCDFVAENIGLCQCFVGQDLWMAVSTVSQSSGLSRWKQWWRRSPNTCCSKRVLLLLVWQMLFTFTWCVLVVTPLGNGIVSQTSLCLSYSSASFIGWLADVRFGRYEVIKFGSIASFLAGILYYFAMFAGESFSTLSTVLFSVSFCIVSFQFISYLAAVLPFLTDQIIGATSGELSSVVRWYVWMQFLGAALSEIVIYFNLLSNSVNVCFFAIPLAVIVISDCLCQQWLDRTHKVTNPIKLIIQVLNYTRKHRYPERRSAFTYIDEEQPTRMDYGKDKFGGPFTEEEVEDVKTVLRLLPLVICYSVSVGALETYPMMIFLFDDTESNLFLNQSIMNWLFPILLIPLYQLLINRFFHSCSPSMLRSMSAGLFMCSLGFIILSAFRVYGVVLSNNLQGYLSCTAPLLNTTLPSNHFEWYWKLGPYILYGIGKTIIFVLVLEFIIAQSPDKMKGFLFGVMLGCTGLVYMANIAVDSITFTICCDIIVVTGLVVLFVVFLVLSKRYTLRERNREINIQAIVEEHYERYMDQEEEYMRQNHA